MKRIAIFKTLFLYKFLIVCIWIIGVLFGLVFAIIHADIFVHLYVPQPHGGIWGTAVVLGPLLFIFLFLKFGFQKLALALLLIKSFLYSFCYFSLLSLLQHNSCMLFSYALFSGAMSSVVSVLIVFNSSIRGSNISSKWLYAVPLIILLDIFFYFVLKGFR